MKKKIIYAVCIIMLIALGVVLGIFVFKKTKISDLVITKKNESLAEDVVAKVGKKNITKTELGAYYAAMKSEVESIYSDKVWDFKVSESGTSYQEVLKSSVLDKIIFIKLVCSFASEYGVELTPDDYITIEGYVNDFFASINKDVASEYNLTKEIVSNIYRENVLCKKVYDKITLNADTNANEENCRQADFIRIVLYKYEITPEGEKSYYNEEEVENIKKEASIYAAKSSANEFYNLARRVSQADDPRITCGVSDIEASISEAVFKLGKDEMTDILETDDAIYIYYCENDKNSDATIKAITEKTEKDRKMYFSTLYTKWKDSTTIEIDDEKVKSVLK